MSYQYIPMQRELDAQKLFDEVGADELKNRLDAIGEHGYATLTDEETNARLEILRALTQDPSTTPRAAKERLLERAKNRKLEFEKKKKLRARQSQETSDA